METEKMVQLLDEIYDYLLIEKELPNPTALLAKKIGISDDTIARIRKRRFKKLRPLTRVKIDKFLDKYSKGEIVFN